MFIPTEPWFVPVRHSTSRLWVEKIHPWSWNGAKHKITAVVAETFFFLYIFSDLYFSLQVTINALDTFFHSGEKGLDPESLSCCRGRYIFGVYQFARHVLHHWLFMLATWEKKGHGSHAAVASTLNRAFPSHAANANPTSTAFMKRPKILPVCFYDL